MKPSIKSSADEILEIAQEAMTKYLINFFLEAGQTITKEHAENIISKVGIRIAIKNETLSPRSK